MMVTSTRSDTRKYRYWYPTVCRGSDFVYTGEGSWPYKYEYVESFRGKPEFLAIGKRKVRKYNPFVRYSATWNKPPVFRWCPEPSNMTLLGVDIPAVNISMQADEKSPYIAGSWPLIGKSRMEDFVATRQDFTSRDLFVKLKEPRFDGLVQLAELDETIAGMRKLLEGSVKALLSGNQAWQTARNIALNPQDLWLWYRYALMPAILSVNDLLEAFRPRDEISRIQTGSRKRTTLTTGTLYHRGWTFTGFSIIDLEMPWSCEVTYSSGGALDLSFVYDPHEWGVSSIDLIRASYERIPFSFVFDWFFNVGEWLQTMRDVNFGIVQSYSTVAVESVTTFHAGKDCYYEGGDPQVKSFLQQRITGLEPPQTPLIDSEWRNLLRTIDSIALIIGILKGVLTRRK